MGAARHGDVPPRPRAAIGEATLRWLRDSASFGILTTDASLHIIAGTAGWSSATGISEDCGDRPASAGRPPLVHRAGVRSVFADDAHGSVTVPCPTRSTASSCPARADAPREQPIPQRGRIALVDGAGGGRHDYFDRGRVGARRDGAGAARAIATSEEREDRGSCVAGQGRFLATLSHEIRTWAQRRARLDAHSQVAHSSTPPRCSGRST